MGNGLVITAVLKDMSVSVGFFLDQVPWDWGLWFYDLSPFTHTRCSGIRNQ